MRILLSYIYSINSKKCKKMNPVKVGIDIDVKCYELPQYNYSFSDIKTYDSRDLQYDIFFKEHMMKNLPCIIKNISHTWLCSREWVKNGSINCDYFLTQYGDIDAPVADCDSITFNSHCKINMKVCDYMNYLKIKNKDKLLYLKDWHLKRIMPDNNFYEVPKIFTSDWLNEFASDYQDDDFMFVYIGAEGTWTPFHADVYTSYSWSVNVVGRKKWILLPPGEEEKIKDSLGNLPLLFNAENNDNIKYFEIIQEQGDGIFVPSGWHHQVFNLLDTISVNHNFINACNIEIVWNSLQKNLISVEHEIEEFKNTPEFTTQCQLILKSVFGMDFEGFIKFIMHIAQKRLNNTKGDFSLLFNTYYFERNHVIFDLHQLRKIINLIQNHPLFIEHILSNGIISKLLNIKSAINKILQLE